MLRVGLTGGIAAGKSAASREFAKLGAVIIDYDALAREAVAPSSPVLAKITEQFGPELVNEQGELNRAALAAQVFNDPAALEKLNQLVHPRVYELAAELEAKAVAENPGCVIVHDIPLLVEQGLAPKFDVIVVVETDQATREQRLIETRGLSKAEAQARIAAGATDAARRQVGTHFLAGGGSLTDMKAQVNAMWRDFGRL